MQKCGNVGVDFVWERILKYTRFEDLPCWQKARELCQQVNIAGSDGAFCTDFALKDQMRKASGSVMDNIAEGFDNLSRQEFIRFLGYSVRSCSEVQSQLYRALDCNHIKKETFHNVYQLAEDCKMQIKGFLKYLRTREKNDA